MSVLEVTRRLHVYTRWANSRLLEAMSGLTPGELAEPAPVAFGNLRGALWHMIGAELGWLTICSGVSQWSRMSVHDTQSLEGLAELLHGADGLWAEFLDSRTEDDVLAVANLPIDEPFRQSAGPELVKWADHHGHRPRRPMWQSALHVVNHATQHRAEIGMYLHSLGRSPDDMDYGTFEEYRAVRDGDWHDIRWSS